MFNTLKHIKRQAWSSQQYCFSSLKLGNGKSLSFPFNFSGVSKTGDAKQVQLFETALEQIYDANVKDGFKYAYTATLEAFAQKDTEFFEDICEPRLYEEITEGFEELDRLGLKIEGENLDSQPVKLTLDSFRMIYGVKHVRSQNFRENDYIKRNMNFNGLDMEVYQAKSIDPSYLLKLYPFLQIGCTFQSDANLILRDKNGDIVAGEDSNNRHRIIFESVNESENADGINHIQNLAQSMSGLFGTVGMFANKDAMKGFMGRLFSTKDLTWKIVDIDNHLKGNPFSN